METNERKIEYETRSTLIRELASHLAEWTFTPSKDLDEQEKPQYRYLPTLNHASGMQLSFSMKQYGEKPNMMHVSCGKWPTYKDKDGQTLTVHGRNPGEWKDVHPSINVSTLKTSKVMASDISRRLIADYTRMWADAKTRADAHASYANTEENLMREVCKLWGVPYREPMPYGQGMERSRPGMREISLYDAKGAYTSDSVKVSGDRIKLELEVSLDTLRAIKALLGDTRKGKG